MTEYITFACPSCGASLHVSSSTNSLKCDYCGHEHVVRRQGGEVAVEQINTWICPKCGTPTSIGTSFCPKCGFVLARSCPNCKRLIFINTIYCPECGVNIAETEQKNIIRQEERQQSRGEKNLLIAQLNNEIAQKKLEMSKVPRREPYITILGVVGLIFACLFFLFMLSTIDSSSGALSGISLVFLFASIIVTVVFFYFDINRNKANEENKQRKAAEVFLLMNRVSELQKELKQME